MNNNIKKDEKEIVLKVKSNSSPNSIVGALVGHMKETNIKKVTLQAIGAGAVNQAIKAIAIARGFVAPMGTELVCIPAFTKINMDEFDRTAIKLIVKEV